MCAWPKAAKPGAYNAARTSTNPRLPLETTMATSQDQAREQLRLAALEYHEFPTPGKIAVAATKQMTNQRDLEGTC